MRQIKVNDTVLTVLEVYPYMYKDEKEVIRIKVSEENHTYSDIEVLKNAGNIQYLEDDVLKNEYAGYTQDYKSTFYNGVWSIEIAQKSEQDIRIEELEQGLIELAELVGGAE